MTSASPTTESTTSKTIMSTLTTGPGGGSTSTAPSVSSTLNTTPTNAPTTVTLSSSPSGAPGTSTGTSNTTAGKLSITTITSNTVASNSTVDSNSTVTSSSTASATGTAAPLPRSHATHSSSTVSSAIVTPAVSPSSLSSPVLSASKSPISPGTKQCPAPPAIPNGSPSNGPYNPGAAVTYACSAGFTLVSNAAVKCGTDLKWPTTLPRCLSSSSGAQGQKGDGQGGDNNVYLGDGVPLWLAIVLGLTFGVICLMMLTCLVIYCLRMCGCIKGSLLGDVTATSTVAPSQGGGSHVVPEIPMANKATAISYIELDPFDDYQTVSTGGRPPEDNRYRFTRDGRKGQQNNRRGRFVEEQNNNNNNTGGWSSPRKKAKKPTNPTWMPHAQQRRNINTSTQ